MKKLVAILTLLLIPTIGYCRNSGEAFFGFLIFLLIMVPYIFLAMIPFAIQMKNNGKNLFLSILTYLLCIGGIALAKYDSYGSGMPGLDLMGDDGIFYLMILPFVIVMIFAAIKDYNYKYDSNE